MDRRYIIVGQKVNRVKVERARQLRHTMTEDETLLWGYIRNQQLEGLRFRRQQVIDGFIVDFYCHSAGIVIEVDGDVHDLQQEADAERDHLLSSRGLKILRVKNDEVRHNIKSVLSKITALSEEEKSVDVLEE